MPTLTDLHQSGVAALRYCPRRYYASEMLRLEPVETTTAMRLGTAVHHGLEIASRARRGMERGEAFAAIRTLGLSAMDGIWARAMVLAYLDHHDGLPGQTYGAELEVSGEIPGSDMRFVGTVDRIIEAGDRLYIVDYKTTGRYSDDYVESLRLRLQGPLYAHYLERSSALSVAGIIYEVIERPGNFSPKKVTRYTEEPIGKLMTRGKNKGLYRVEDRETMPEFEARLQKSYLARERVHRPTINFDPECRQRAVRELSLAAEEIQWRRSTENWPRNPRNCVTIFGRCPYYALCQSGFSPVVAQNDYRRRRCDKNA